MPGATKLKSTSIFNLNRIQPYKILNVFSYLAISHKGENIVFIPDDGPQSELFALLLMDYLEDTRRKNETTIQRG